MTAAGRSKFNDELSYAEFEELAARAVSLDHVIATSPQQTMQALRPDAATPETIAVRLVSPNYFTALGVANALGRGLVVGDATAGVLSYEAWQRRFNGDPAIIGKSLQVQNTTVAIVGVAAKAFVGTGYGASAPDLWLPLALQPTLLPTVDWLHDPTIHAWQVLARRKSNLSLAQVSAELDVLGRAWPQPDGKTLRLAPQPATLFDVNYPEFKAVCAVLMTAVAMVLLIGCVNVVNLLAARHTARAHELAMRHALGAGRGRLVRQLCTESILLGLIGGAGGLALSWWACEVLRVWLSGLWQRITGGSISFTLDVSPDWHVLAYALGVSVATGIGAAVWPALRATRASLESQLKRSASEHGASETGRSRHRLLATQIAACLLLLAGAGLLFRGAARALRTEPGFDARHLFVLRINPRTTAQDAATHLALLREVQARVGALPEVDAVTSAERAPYFGHSIGPFLTDEERWVDGCVSLRADANYFATLRLPLIAGRGFTPQEVETRASVVVISESAARRFWPGSDPLGRRIFQPRRGRDGGREAFTVIGVAKDARLTLLSQTDAADVFFPRPLAADGWFLVHTRGAPETALPATLAALRQLDSTLPSQSLLLTMEKGPMEIQRLLASGPAMFASVVGVVALVLAAVGIYGVVSFVVARRTREFGVHLALGATGGDVVALVLRQTLRPVAWGAGIGLAGAVVLSVVIKRLVLNPEIPDLTYGAGAFPSATLIAVFALLLGVILLAAIIPALRAAKVDPMVALRAE